MRGAEFQTLGSKLDVQSVLRTRARYLFMLAVAGSLRVYVLGV